MNELRQVSDEMRNFLFRKQCKKLQEINEENKKAQAEAISKMSDRELLEAIYRKLV